MSLLRSLGKVLCNTSLHATVACLPAIPSPAENRRALARKAQAAVNATLDEFCAASLLPGAAATGSTFHQFLIRPSSCGNNASLNSFTTHPGDDDAEPDPAATPAA
jgi:hypothetical protein